MAAKLVLVHTDQAALPNRRHRLQSDRIARPLVAGKTEFGQPSRDRARGHDDALMPQRAQLGHFAAELFDGTVRDHTVVVGDRRRTDLGDDPARRHGLAGHRSSSYSNSNSPTRTTSPERTPARTSSRSTPRL